MKVKSLFVKRGFTFRHRDGARTHDPQNHNLVL